MIDGMRAIETSGYAKLDPPASFGKLPKLEWLSIKSLFVDPQYQREITLVGRKNVRRIAESFNWSMFGTVMVASLGGGKYAVMDGQHRTTAAALCGIEKVPCQVVEAMRGDQAKAFRAINANTTRPHAIQLFHAAVTAGEESALKIISVCKRAGISVPRSLSGCRDFETYCVASIGKSINAHGEAVTILALRLIVHSGDGRPEDLNRTIIGAVTLALARGPKWHNREVELKAIFETFDLEDMWRAAVATAARVKGSSSTDILRAAITKPLTDKLGGGA